MPGPGFRACGFSRLTGGQWAGASAGLGPAGLWDHPGFGGALLGLAGPGLPPAGTERPGHAGGGRGWSCPGRT